MLWPLSGISFLPVGSASSQPAYEKRPIGAAWSPIPGEVVVTDQAGLLAGMASGGTGSLLSRSGAAPT